jgi:hypothetical protein
MTAPTAAPNVISRAALVRQKYRSLGRLIRKLPEENPYAKKKSLPNQLTSDKGWAQLRQEFRKCPTEDIAHLLKKADDKISFLKMITPKADAYETVSGGGDALDVTTSTGGRWIYRNGQRLEFSEGTLRDSNGRVVSNWDGKNLDPDSVKRHNHHLKRLGFRNNSHAKGIF